MTPVATPTATQAISWDAALAEILENAAAHPFADHSMGTALSMGTVHSIGTALSMGTVHSVHRRVVNVLVGGELIAIADETLDDAPGTIRVPTGLWRAAPPAVGTPVHVQGSAVVFAAPDGDVVVRLGTGHRWMPAPADLCCLPTAQLRAAGAMIAAGPVARASTPFGRAAASVISERLEGLRAAVLHERPATVTTAAQGLVGLGEGLTPTGDDVLTGLAFLAAQPGMRLGAHLPAIAAVDLEATTLLSAVTLRHALQGRARQRIHDLALALGGDEAGILRAAARIREIGHTSGEDLLTGIRLALDLESALRDGSR